MNNSTYSLNLRRQYHPIRCVSRGLLVLLLGIFILLQFGSMCPAHADLTKKERVDVFLLVWGRVNERFFDPTFHGVNWAAVKKTYLPKVVAAKSDLAFYSLLNHMLEELKQSHFAIIPPSAYLPSDDSKTDTDSGDAGMTVQLVGNEPIVTKIQANSAASKAGITPGCRVVSVGGKAVQSILTKIHQRKLPLVKERVEVWIAMLIQLRGPVDTEKAIEVLTPAGETRKLTLKLQEPQGEMTQLGELPPMPVQVETKRLDGGYGYIRINVFLMPILDKVRTAVASMKDCPSIIVDLRGNPGGMGGLSNAIAGLFFAKRTNLGTMKLRTGEMRFPVFPVTKPYAGPLVILTDEGSLSTSEILAGSLQELGRAVVCGRPTGGMVLPSQVELLPGGARLQYAIGDFKTPKGVLLEGRGVRPDINVELTPLTLASESDLILSRAITYLKNQAAGHKAAGVLNEKDTK